MAVLRTACDSPRVTGKMSVPMCFFLALPYDHFLDNSQLAVGLVVNEKWIPEFANHNRLTPISL